MTLTRIYDDNNAKTNAEIIEETYYEYHGRYDDGDSPADIYDGFEVIAV